MHPRTVRESAHPEGTGAEDGPTGRCRHMQGRRWSGARLARAGSGSESRVRRRAGEDGVSGTGFDHRYEERVSRRSGRRDRRTVRDTHSVTRPRWCGSFLRLSHLSQESHTPVPVTGPVDDDTGVLLTAPRRRVPREPQCLWGPVFSVLMNAPGPKPSASNPTPPRL